MFSATKANVRTTAAAQDSGQDGALTVALYGGSIIYSHAFDDEKMRSAYHLRFGQSRLKPRIRSVLWKGAARFTGHVRRNHIDLLKAARRHERLRFLMPIRNPLKCANSNKRTGHWTLIHEDPDPPPADVCDIVRLLVRTIGWFLDLEQQNPQQFMAYHEVDYNELTLRRLARHLNLEAPDSWLADCAPLYVAGRKYDYAPALIDAYSAAIDEYVSHHPEARNKLQSYLQAPEPTQLEAGS